MLIYTIKEIILLNFAIFDLTMSRWTIYRMHFLAWTALRDVIFSIRSVGFAWTYVYRALYHDAGDRERSDCGWGCRVARSRNEICVTRGPTSPGLALLLLSSAQLSSARFNSTLGKGGTLYYSIMSFELYARARAKVRPGQGANRSNEERERDRKRLRPFLFHPYELATPYSWISTSLPPALRAQPLWNCSYSINFTPGANYHKIIGSPFPPRLVRSRAGPS